MRAVILFSAIFVLAACQHDHHKNFNAEAVHLFTLMDEDRDGEFSKQELQLTFNKYDTNNDHRVTEKEFYMTLCSENPEICPYVISIFQLLDTLNENVIWESNLDNVYNVLDTNDDGKVSRTEFTSWMTNELTTFSKHNNH